MSFHKRMKAVNMCQWLPSAQGPTKPLESCAWQISDTFTSKGLSCSNCIHFDPTHMYVCMCDFSLAQSYTVNIVGGVPQKVPNTGTKDQRDSPSTPVSQYQWNSSFQCTIWTWYLACIVWLIQFSVVYCWVPEAKVLSSSSWWEKHNRLLRPLWVDLCPF